MIDTSQLTWRKSSRSGGNGGMCVEVAELPGGVAIRDSKDPAGPMLRVSSAEWRDFLASLR
jgi:Domain of unknown function (DUF397).